MALNANTWKWEKKHVMLKGLNSISQGLRLTQFEEFGLISGKMLTGSKRQNLYGVHCLVKHESAVIRGNHRNVHCLYLAVWFHVFYVIVPANCSGICQIQTWVHQVTSKKRPGLFASLRGQIDSESAARQERAW